MNETQFNEAYSNTESIYDKMLCHVNMKLSKLNSYEIKRVGGERLYYAKERPKISTVYEVNKRINELNKIKEEVNN